MDGQNYKNFKPGHNKISIKPTTVKSRPRLNTMACIILCGWISGGFFIKVWIIQYKTLSKSGSTQNKMPFTRSWDVVLDSASCGHQGSVTGITCNLEFDRYQYLYRYRYQVPIPGIGMSPVSVIGSVWGIFGISVSVSVGAYQYR